MSNWIDVKLYVIENALNRHIILNIIKFKHKCLSIYLIFTSDWPKHNVKCSEANGNAKLTYIFVFHNSVGNKHTLFIPFAGKWLPVLHSEKKSYRQLLGGTFFLNMYSICHYSFWNINCVTHCLPKSGPTGRCQFLMLSVKLNVNNSRNS